MVVISRGVSYIGSSSLPPPATTKNLTSLGVIWYGWVSVVWCGVVWCGVVWCWQRRCSQGVIIVSRGR